MDEQVRELQPQEIMASKAEADNIKHALTVDKAAWDSRDSTYKATVHAKAGIAERKKEIAASVQGTFAQASEQDIANCRTAAREAAQSKQKTDLSVDIASYDLKEIFALVVKEKRGEWYYTMRGWDTMASVDAAIQKYKAQAEALGNRLRDTRRAVAQAQEELRRKAAEAAQKEKERKEREAQEWQKKEEARQTVAAEMAKRKRRAVRNATIGLLIGIAVLGLATGLSLRFGWDIGQNLAGVFIPMMLCAALCAIFIVPWDKNSKRVKPYLPCTLAAVLTAALNYIFLWLFNAQYQAFFVNASAVLIVAILLFAVYCFLTDKKGWGIAHLFGIAVIAASVAIGAFFPGITLSSFTWQFLIGVVGGGTVLAVVAIVWSFIVGAHSYVPGFVCFCVMAALHLVLRILLPSQYNIFYICFSAVFLLACVLWAIYAFYTVEYAWGYAVLILALAHSASFFVCYGITQTDVAWNTRQYLIGIGGGLSVAGLCGVLFIGLLENEMLFEPGIPCSVTLWVLAIGNFLLSLLFGAEYNIVYICFSSVLLLSMIAFSVYCGWQGEGAWCAAQAISAIVVIAMLALGLAAGDGIRQLLHLPHVSIPV